MGVKLKNSKKTNEQLSHEIDQLKNKITELELQKRENKKKERLLHESEEKYKALVTNSEEIVYIIDIEGNYILSEGKGLSKLNLKPGELVGKSIFDLYIDYPEMLNKMIRTFRGETTSFETTIGSNNFNNWYTPYMDKEGRIIGLLGLSVNITDQKIVKEKLNQNEQLYRTIGETIPYGIWTTDADGMFLYISPSFLKMVGMTLEFIQEFGLKHLLHPDIAESIMEHWDQCFKNGENFQRELKIKSKDSGYKHVLVIGRPIKDSKDNIIKWVGINLDINEQKQRENAIKIQDLIMSKVSEAIYLFRAKDGIIQYTNHEFESMFGYSSNEMVGKHVSIVNAPNEKSNEISKEMLATTAETGKWEGEVYNVKKDGSNFWCYTHVSSFNHPQFGEVIISVHRDISEKKQIETKLVQTNQILEAVQKTAKVGYWHYDIALQKPTWSAEMFSIYGLNKDDKVPTYFEHKEKLHPEDKEIYDIALQDCISGTPYNIVIRILYPDNSYHYVLTQGFPITDDSGEINELFGTTKDITEMKVAETSLKEKQITLNQAEKAVKLGIWKLNLTTSKISWSTHMYEIFEIDNSIKENLQALFEERIHPDDKKKTLNRYRKALKARVNFEIEYRIILPDGTERIVFHQGEPVLDENEEITSYRGIAQNITIQKKAENKIMEARNLLHASQKAAHIGSWWVSISDMTFHWTPEVFHIFGLKSDKQEPDFDEYLKFIHEDDIFYVKKKSKKLLKHFNDALKYSYRIKLSNGEVKHLDHIAYQIRNKNGEIIRLFGTIQDVTERINIQNKLKESEIKFRKFSHISPVGIFITDEKGETTYWNKRLCKAAGLSYSKKEGYRWMENIVEDDKEKIKKVFNESLVKSEKFNTEFRFRDNKGNINWVAMQAEPLKRKKSIKGYVGSLIDITEQKEAEKKLNKDQDNFDKRLYERTKELEQKIKDMEKAIKVSQGRELTIKKLQNKIRTLKSKSRFSFTRDQETKNKF